MPQGFQPGDFLIFQLEAGYGLLRFLGNSTRGSETVWHLAAYDDLFLDADSVELAIASPERLSLSNPHLALTTRAFESTQVAGMGNLPLKDDELLAFIEWVEEDESEVTDRSVRLMLGMR